MINKILIIFLLATLTSCLGLPSFANNKKENSQIVVNKNPEIWKIQTLILTLASTAI
jgi:hypothetical protein